MTEAGTGRDSKPQRSTRNYLISALLGLTLSGIWVLYLVLSETPLWPSILLIIVIIVGPFVILRLRGRN